MRFSKPRSLRLNSPMYSLAVLSRTPRTALVGFLRKIVGHVKERCLEELCEVKGLVAVAGCFFRSGGQRWRIPSRCLTPCSVTVTKQISAT